MPWGGRHYTYGPTLDSISLAARNHTDGLTKRWANDPRVIEFADLLQAEPANAYFPVFMRRVWVMISSSINSLTWGHSMPVTPISVQ